MPVVTKHFLEKPDSAPLHSSKFTPEQKIKKKIPGTSWPAQPLELSTIENVGLQLLLSNWSDGVRRMQSVRFGGRCLLNVF